MAYFITYFDKTNKVKFKPSSSGFSVFKSKDEAEMVLGIQLSSPYAAMMGFSGFAIREFKNVAEAKQWAKDNSASN